MLTGPLGVSAAMDHSVRRGWLLLFTDLALSCARFLPGLSACSAAEEPCTLHMQIGPTCLILAEELYLEQPGKVQPTPAYRWSPLHISKPRYYITPFSLGGAHLSSL